jgi:uncharacterized membrane protein
MPMVPRAHSEASGAVRTPGLADVVLRGTAGLWFFVTVLGLWVFLYRVVSQYGVATLSGRFEDWERNNQLYSGYVAGDAIGNLAFAAHVMLAAVVTVGGALQLIPQIRERAITLHRWNGRVFMLAGVVAALTGLYMNWVRHANSGPVNSYGVSLNGVLILLCVAMAWRAVRAGDIDRHRRWALRAFMVMNGVFLKRLGSFGWGMLTSGANMPVMDYMFEFGSYLIPLAVLELYLRARASRTRYAQLATAGVLLVVTAYMCVGTVAYARWVLRKHG